jgi:hypothetical protein
MGRYDYGDEGATSKSPDITATRSSVLATLLTNRQITLNKWFLCTRVAEW